MTQTLPPRSECADAAVEEAHRNFARNLSELRGLLPEVELRLADEAVDVEWLFGRDGSLTAVEAGERWWGGCSLPRRAGQFMLKSMEIGGVVACFLNPIHAAHLRAALDLLEPQQAIIAIVPEPRTLWVMLHCEDFSQDFRAHRLWFVTGEWWESDLSKLFVESPGLPTPSQFIRAISADGGPADVLIEPAQRIFADEGTRRGGVVSSLAEAWRRRESHRKKLCVVAPSRFRLWNDAPFALTSVLKNCETEDFDWSAFDSDDPLSASPLALAGRLGNCEALLTANLSRADLPGIVPIDMPLIVWVTMPRIPAIDLAGPRDRLLVADPDWRDQAIRAGWTEKQIAVASWPQSSSKPVDGNSFSLIADTLPLDPPRQVTDFSSHRLLWEMIQSELTRDPFLIGDSVDEYLDQRMARLRISSEAFNRSFFIERLIIQAYQQGLARFLIDRKMSLQLFGAGWQEIGAFASVAKGFVESREQLHEIVSGSSALVHCWPFASVHPIDATGRAVVRAFGRTRKDFCTEPVLRQRGVEPLSFEVLSSLLRD